VVNHRFLFLLLLNIFFTSFAANKGEITKDFIEKYLPSNPLIIDAGAYDGKDSIAMAKKWKGSQVYSFEPIPHLYKNLQRNTNKIPNIKCFQLALAGTNGSVKMYVSDGKENGSSSLLMPKEHLNVHPQITFDEQIMVTGITIDHWAELNNITNIDFLWLDLQGLELEVLKSSPKILKTVKVIHAEVSLIETYEGVPLYSELRDWLEKEGFTVIKEELPWRDMGNVLFVRMN
jgi:2-O-methyltransferase